MGYKTELGSQKRSIISARIEDLYGYEALPEKESPGETFWRRFLEIKKDKLQCTCIAGCCNIDNA